MQSVIFLAILAFASALPNFINYQKDIRIDDDRIIVSNGQGKRILIKKPTDEKTKQVEVVIAGHDGLNRKISIDKNMHVIKDVHPNEYTTGLFKNLTVKLNSSNVTDNQFHTLTVIFKDYQGIINAVTYEQLLGKLREAVENKKIHEVIYEALKSFDSDEEFNPMTGGGLGSHLLTPTTMDTHESEPLMFNQGVPMMPGQQQPIFRQREPPMYNKQKPFMFDEQQRIFKPNSVMSNEQEQSMFTEQGSMYNRQPYTQDQQQPLYQQQYPMYNHQTFNWNQLSQQYGHNFVNQLSQEPYDSNTNNLEYHYQYAQEMSQTVKQTLDYLKQLEQTLVSHGQQDVQVQQEIQQVQKLFNVVEQNFEHIQTCKSNPNCVTYFGKNWYAIFGQKTTGQENVYYGQPMNGQNVYGQTAGQNVLGHQQGFYGQQSSLNSHPMNKQLMVTGSQNQVSIEQIRNLRWQLMQKSQSSLQQFKIINQELQLLINSINQQQNDATSLFQQWQTIRYKLISLVSQETTIQKEIYQIHEQMSNFAKQIIPGFLTTEDQLTSTAQMQQKWWTPQQSQQFPIMQNNMPQQPQYMSLQQQKMIQQQQMPTMKNNMAQQPEYTSLQQQMPTQQQQWSMQQDRMPLQQQQQQMPVLQNNMMMMRNKAQWPVSYNM